MWSRVVMSHSIFQGDKGDRGERVSEGQVCGGLSPTPLGHPLTCRSPPGPPWARRRRHSSRGTRAAGRTLGAVLVARAEELGAVLGQRAGAGPPTWGSHLCSLPPRVSPEALDPEAQVAPLGTKEKR